MDIVQPSTIADNQISSNSPAPDAGYRVDPETGEKLPPKGAPRAPFSGARSATAGGAAANPPLGNTGVHASLGHAAVSPDYLTFTAHVELSELLPVLDQVGLGVLDKREGGTRFCHEAYTGLHGLFVQAVPRDDRQNFCIVDIPGDCCNWLGVDGFDKLQFALWVLGQETGAKVNITRIDIAVDTQAFPARWFASALREGAIDRRSEAYDVHESAGDGCTVYLGASTSDKRWRVYHKMDGSTFGEGVPFTRVEQQFRREAAAAVYGMLFNRSTDEWGRLAAELLNDYAQVNKRWWRAFVGTVKKAMLVVHRSRSTIEKTCKWIEKQVACSLALVVDGKAKIDYLAGQEWLQKVLFDGRRRRSKVDSRKVATNELDGLPRLAATRYSFA